MPATVESNPTRATALTVCNVSKGFGTAAAPIQVLRDFNLQVGEGEFVSLFGPNGCGKTTLLHLIAGITEPDAGTIQPRLDGQPRRNAGMVFQNYEKSLMPWRTCLDNILLPLERARGKSLSQLRAIARDAVAALGIVLPFERYPYELSGGQKQLTCIARAMVTHPNLLLLDEPFASLDYQTRISTQNTLQEVWLRTQVSTIFISHEIDEAIFLADRVCVLTARPAKIAEIFEVHLPRPRDLSTFSSPEFIAMRRAILDRFTKEMSP